ncbi:MAG: hypothetical protein SPD98_05200, partial [Tractidigestivibacter sp.]|uniref:hypothetical protein n=1 Tax=Tractidigestivibacter sp. TaxID=2847320 RepID=UPI002A7F200F
YPIIDCIDCMRACIVCPVELYHLPPPALSVQLPRIHVERISTELELEFMRSLDMPGGKKRTHKEAVNCAPKLGRDES